MSNQQIKNNNDQMKKKSYPNLNETEENETTYHSSNLCQNTGEKKKQNKQFQQFGENISMNEAMFFNEEEIQKEEEEQELQTGLKKFQKTNEVGGRLKTSENQGTLKQKQKKDQSIQMEEQSHKQFNKITSNLFANLVKGDEFFYEYKNMGNMKFAGLYELKEKQEKIAKYKHSEILKKKVEYLEEVNSYLEKQSKFDQQLYGKVLVLDEKALEKSIESTQNQVLELEKQNSIYLEFYDNQERKNRHQFLEAMCELKNVTLLKLNNELLENCKENSKEFKLNQACSFIKMSKHKFNIYRSFIVRKFIENFLKKNKSITGYQFKSLKEYFQDENSVENVQRFYTFLQEIKITNDNWKNIEKQDNYFYQIPPTMEQIKNDMYLINLKNTCCQEEHVYTFLKMYNYLLTQNNEE